MKVNYIGRKETFISVQDIGLYWAEAVSERKKALRSSNDMT
jgi:hypothetical protein